MHGNPRQDTIFTFDDNQLDFAGQSSLSSSSEYWNYGPHSSSSSYSSQHNTLPYASSQKHARPWSNDSVTIGLESSFPRSVNSYDASLRSTDLREHSMFASNTDLDMWPSSQLSSHYVSDPSWDNIVFPGIDTSETKPIIHQHQHHILPNMISGSCSPLSTISSPSPSPSPVLAPLQTSGLDDVPKSKSKTNNNGPIVKMCSHCRATSTPLWRREPSTLRTLCNACGLYLQQRNKLRPQELIDADLDNDETADNSGSEQDTTGPQCSHCRTRNTSVWRRSKTGAQLCNACGVYARLRGRDRPLSLKRNKIKPRTKHNKLMDKH